MDKILLDAGPSERGWHRIEGASRCLRLYAWRESGMLPRLETDPLIKGSLLHIGLAHFYAQMKAKQEGQDPDVFFSPEDAVRVLSAQGAREASKAHAAAVWRVSVPQIIMALQAYRSRWEHCDWQPVAVEEELRAKIPNFGREGSFLFTQRADLIVKDSSDIYWIVDHKSCYRIENKTLRQHILSGQFIGYQLFGRRVYGEQFGGVIVNRVKLSEPYLFDRTVLEPAPDAIKRFAKNLAIQEYMVDMFNGIPPGQWPAVYSDQVCWGKYGKCAAFELCQWGDSDAIQEQSQEESVRHAVRRPAGTGKKQGQKKPGKKTKGKAGRST